MSRFKGRQRRNLHSTDDDEPDQGVPRPRLCDDVVRHVQEGAGGADRTRCECLEGHMLRAILTHDMLPVDEVSKATCSGDDGDGDDCGRWQSGRGLLWRKWGVATCRFVWGQHSKY